MLILPTALEPVMHNTFEPSQTTLTREPIRLLIDPLQRFSLIEAADGGILLIAAIFALIVANATLGGAYLIAGLALEADLLNHAKIGIMIGSLLSTVAGMTVLLLYKRRLGNAGANSSSN